MKKIINKALVTTIVIGLLSVAGFAFATDFSGTWILDKDKSAGLPPNFDQTLKIKQNETQIEVEAVIKGAQGEQTVRDVYVLGGKEVEFVPPVLGSVTARKGKRTSKLSAEGKVLEVTEEAPVTGPDGEFMLKAKRRWSLSADGKTLTMEMTIDGPTGLLETKRVFVRQ